MQRNPSMRLLWGGLWLVVLSAIAVMVCRWALAANLDLIDGRFALFMDERLTFDGVKKILYPASVLDWLRNVVDGGDHRYGRSVWNVMALTGALPSYLGGEPAQIVAGRLTQMLILLGAFTVLAWAVTPYWPLRVALVGALLVMPSTDYYMTMPKPEPLQLLCLALFLHGYVRRQMQPEGWYWLWLGLALGTKISTLPALILFVGASLLRYIDLRDRSTWARYWNVGRWLLGGLLIAVPFLLVNTLLSLALYRALQWLLDRRQVSGLRRARWLWGGAAALVILAVLLRPGYITWFEATFLQTAHRVDDPSITARSWAEFFVNAWMNTPVSWTAALMGLLALCAAVMAVRFLRAKLWAQRDWPAWAVPLVLLAVGLALNAAIFVSVKRLWGFYLFTGTALTLAGLVGLLSSHWAEAPARRFSLTTALLAVTTLVGLWVAGAYWRPAAEAYYASQTRRTAQPEHRVQMAAYRGFMGYLDSLSAARPDTAPALQVQLDPFYYLPWSTERRRIVEFWGPYTEWDRRHEVLVFSVRHTPQGDSLPPSSPDHAAYVREQAAYRQRVIGATDTCRTDYCYARVRRLADGGEVLRLRLPQMRP